MNAEQARKQSEQNKIKLKLQRNKNAKKKRLEDSRQEAEHKVWWAKEVEKDYATALENALRVGNRSFKLVISSVINNDLSPKDFMKQYDEAPLMKKIWRSLRVRGYKVEILKKVEIERYDGRSFYEEPSDLAPYTTYIYTAKVSW